MQNQNFQKHLLCQTKRDLQHLGTVINKSARYTETALKILWSKEAHDEESLSSLSSVLMAHINFLQEEQANVLSSLILIRTRARYSSPYREVSQPFQNPLLKI